MSKSSAVHYRIALPTPTTHSSSTMVRLHQFGRRLSTATPHQLGRIFRYGRPTKTCVDGGGFTAGDYTNRLLCSKANNDHATAEDYFALFQLPTRFLLDETILKNNYRALMKEFHPDKQQQPANATESSTTTTTMDPSLITHAYVTLRRPHTRAQYLMELLGHGIGDTDRPSPDLILPPGFLLEMMEQREALEDAAAKEQVAELEKLRDTTVQRIQELGQELQDALDAATEDDSIVKAQQCTAMLQYYNRMLDSVVDKLDNDSI